MNKSIPLNVLGRRIHSPQVSWAKLTVVVFALILIWFVGSVDRLTGRDFAVSAFYLVPICWAGWKTGWGAGTFVAIASATAWFVADHRAGVTYQHPFTPYWNALMLLLLFLVVVWLLSAFQRAHYHLEETVHLRTAALQEEIAERKRLEQAKLQAERLAVVGTMAAEVAHEVRNPLASITLNLDLVQKEIDKLAEGKESSTREGCMLVGEMREEILRIQRVIEDYLQFARLPKPQRRPVALNELLFQKLAFVSGEFERANVKLRTHFDPAPRLINVDPEQLWQATLNLIRNSLDAMPEGGELTVGTWCESQQVRLRVTDTGKGMTESQRQQVFTPFFTTKTAGTGLGLTLVQQIVSEHGGHVECESEPGKGSTFTIVLPLLDKSHDNRK
jgi:signal transduction histidine kinase